MSPAIAVVGYQPSWPDEFRILSGVLRQALGDLVLRIDHIGSTAVPGLAAKDVIDIQMTVRQIEPAVEEALKSVGYQRAEHLTQDHMPPGSSEPTSEWVKWVFTEPPDQRRTNVHVRLLGRPNQRYALLFRDYLRAHPATAAAYGRVKRALAARHPDDKDAYYAVKDPVCDIIIGGAEAWAAATGWKPRPSDC